MNHPNLPDIILLLVTGLTALYLVWRFWQRREVYDWYYIMGFAVLFVSGVLLIFLGYGILGTPFVLTVASLIPLGISMGIAEQYFPTWKKVFKWFAALGFLAIAITSFGGMESLKKIVVPLFHSVAGLVIFLGPFFAKGPATGFKWVGIGGLLIGIGGIALAFLSVGRPLLGVFTAGLVLNILSPLLLLMTLAFAWGFVRDIASQSHSGGAFDASNLKTAYLSLWFHEGVAPGGNRHGRARDRHLGHAFRPDGRDGCTRGSS